MMKMMGGDMSRLFGGGQHSGHGLHELGLRMQQCCRAWMAIPQEHLIDLVVLDFDR